MKKFIDTASIEKLLDVPFPRRGNYKFMIVDVEAYIQEVKHDFALEKAGETDDSKYYTIGYGDARMPEWTLDRLKEKRVNSKYGLIIVEEGFDPEVELHTLTKKEMNLIVNDEIEPYERESLYMDEESKQYCSEIAEICNDDADSNWIDCCAGLPSTHNKSVVKYSKELDDWLSD